MLKSISLRIASYFVKYGADPEMEEVYAYGIECTLSTLLILVLLMTAGFILKKPLRMLVGGAHANTHWMCTLISVGLGTVSVWLSDHINKIPAIAIIALSIWCYAVFFLTAPVVHKNHPISERRYRKTRIIARIYAAVECTVIINPCADRLPNDRACVYGIFHNSGVVVYRMVQQRYSQIS